MNPHAYDFTDDPRLMRALINATNLTGEDIRALDEEPAPELDPEEEILNRITRKP